MVKPKKRSSLEVLKKKRLIDLIHHFKLDVSSNEPKAKLVDAISRSKSASFRAVLGQLNCVEMKDICRAHDLNDSGKRKEAIAARILGEEPPEVTSATSKSMVKKRRTSKQAGRKSRATTYHARAEQLAASVWRLCDVLRDDGITYHQYINELSYLLFLKMAAETGLEESLPPDCRWDRLLEHAEKKQLTVYLQMLAQLGGSSEIVIAQIFQNPTSLLRHHLSLNRLVEGINEVEWHETSLEGFGDLYESLLKYSAEKRSGAGQYFTPRPLIEAVVAVMQPTPGEVIQDPALGTAGFLVAASQHLRSVHGPAARARFVGVELVPDNHRLALMNTYLHQLQGTFHLGDALSSLGPELPLADLVLTNPPFGTKRGGGSSFRPDFQYPTANKQLAFLQHIMNTLSPQGRAAVVVPDNVLFEQGAGDAIRRLLVDDFNLHTILRLPAGIFYAAGVETNVIFFQRGSTTETWVFDARTGIPPFTKNSRVLTSEFFDEFVECYGPQSDGSRHATGAGESVRWRRFSVEQIRNYGYKLDHLRWMDSPESAESIEPNAPDVSLSLVKDGLEAAMTEVDDLLNLLERWREE